MEKIKLLELCDLKYKDGQLFFDNGQGYCSVELQDVQTREVIGDIDLPLLKSFYSIFYSDFIKNLNNGDVKTTDIITMYLPDLAEYLGKRRGLKQEEIDSIIKKTQSFHLITGVKKDYKTGRESLYSIFNFIGYNSETNEISFSSPYMNEVIKGQINGR